MMPSWGMRVGVSFGIVLASACSPPPDHPPPEGAEPDSGLIVEDTGAPDSSPTCESLGGRCVDPGASCPIQITGKAPCGSTKGGRDQICCVSD
jgi:hypothetical protein